MTRRFRHAHLAAWLWIGFAGPVAAVDTATLIASTLSPDCLDYHIVGICYWLHCGAFGCSVRTSAKVAHFVPDAVVSSYAATGRNPWDDVALLSPALPGAQGGESATTNDAHEDAMAVFKNADVIGHPGSTAFSRFAGTFGFVCAGAGTPFAPYLLSTLDTVAWRYGLPEAAYPESLTPGLREVGSRTTANLWGNVYPRSGFLHQIDDAKAAAVVAQRAGDIVTRAGQVHVYRALLARPKDGYWPAGALKESDASTGEWQELAPRLSFTCATFPTASPFGQATDGGYAWALWRPYACCKRVGQTFLGSTDFSR